VTPRDFVGASAVGAMLGLLMLAALAILAGCGMSAHETAVRSANVVEAVGRVAIPVLDTCRVVLRRDADTVEHAVAVAEGQPSPIVMSDEEAAAVLAACSRVGHAYDAIQRTHETLLAAIEVAQAAEKAGLSSRWGDVAELVADSLAATEKARQAIEAARVVLRGRS
jgi:hypothetical protein